MAGEAIPTLTQAVDTFYTTTWYEMQRKATDNILDSNVVSALMREKGCFKKQVGQRYIERTVRYGTKTAIAVAKGDTLPTGEDELDTAAFWTWRYLETHVQRSLMDDQQNTGAGKLRDAVQNDLQAARDSLDTKLEDVLLAAINTTYVSGTGLSDGRAARDPYSLQNLLPTTTYNGSSNTTAALYKYGGIDCNYSTNPWWQPKYATAHSPASMNIEDDLRTLYNNCSKNGGTDSPDIILMYQTFHEIFEDVMGAKIQRVTDVGSRTAQLGYDVLKYKGASVVWTRHSSWPDTTYHGCVAMLNSRWLEFIYDPNLWFTMMPWDWLPNQLDRITRIVCATPGIVSPQPRRHGMTTYYTS